MDDGYYVLTEDVLLKGYFSIENKRTKNFYSLMKSKIYKNKRRFIMNRFFKISFYLLVLIVFQKMNSACIIQCRAP